MMLPHTAKTKGCGFVTFSYAFESRKTSSSLGHRPVLPASCFWTQRGSSGAQLQQWDQRARISACYACWPDRIAYEQAYWGYLGPPPRAHLAVLAHWWDWYDWKGPSRIAFRVQCRGWIQRKDCPRGPWNNVQCWLGRLQGAVCLP